MLTITQTPIFSYEAAQNAAKIVKDFVYDLYFPVHGLSSKDIFIYCPTLISIESMVYQVDLTSENAKNIDFVKTKNEDFDTLTKQKINFIKLLNKLNFYDSRIEKELALGEEYVKLENKITAGGIIEHQEVMRVAELRSSDIRLLHCILFRMLGKPYDEDILSLLWSVEVIADIVNDFIDYADDVNQGRYNTYRMFVKLYQEKASDYIKIELDNYENIFKEKIDAFSPEIKQNLTRICSQFFESHSADIPKPIIE